jgi:hypothetical protein
MRHTRTVLRVAAVACSVTIAAVYVVAQSKGGGDAPATQPGTRPASQPSPRDPSLLPGSKSMEISVMPRSDKPAVMPSSKWGGQIRSESIAPPRPMMHGSKSMAPIIKAQGGNILVPNTRDVLESLAFPVTQPTAQATTQPAEKP